MMKPIHASALKLYDKMAEKAKGSEDGHFHGSITAAFREVDKSQNNYTPVTQTLVNLGAITCLQRGARGIESVYSLGGRPTLEDLESIVLTSKKEAATLEVQRQIDAIDKRIGRLDVVEALANLEARVATLEKESRGKV